LFAALPKHVLLISPDVLPVGGIPASGVGVRAWALGQALRERGHHVHFAMPSAALAGREDQVPAQIRALAWNADNLQSLVDSVAPDVIVTVGWPNLTPLQRVSVPVACDLAGPHLLERDYQGYRDNPTNADEKLAALDRADFFTCIGERQRLYFMSWLAQAGVRAADMDTSLKVIPYSLSPDLPEHDWPSRWDGTPVRFVYGGVFLPWQDPSLALDTLATVLAEEGRGRLEVFGGKHPFHAVDTGIFEPLVARLSSNPAVTIAGLRPIADLERSYTAAHVAMDVMRRNPERELAFPSRTVHYLWCGLPVIHGSFSELAPLIAEYEAGWVVDADNAGEIRAVVQGILADPADAARRGANAARLVRERLTWDHTVDALDAFVRRPYLRETRGAWTRRQEQAAAERASVRANNQQAATRGRDDVPGSRQVALPAGLQGLVAATARKRRRPLAQALARGRGLLQPLVPGGSARPVVVEGERRFALGELIGGHSHGQRFVPERDGLCGLDLLVATFARANTVRVVLHLRTDPTGEVLATHEVSALGLQDGGWLRFRFPAIADSGGRPFYVVAEAPRAVPGDAITFWARMTQPDEASGRYEDGVPAPGDLVYRLVFR
ncbi:MAG TPA: glycosyltransferase family 4 protein, partial [Chloroflexia bacterium]|nr:glycosyltransferase family 4 protein [Chloroflexia bacterium]